MRLMLITALYPPAIGGAATYFGGIAPQLAQRDDIEQVVVLTERMPNEPHTWSQGGLKVLRYLPTRVSLPQRPWLIHTVTYLLTQAWFTMRLPGLVQHHGASLVHFHTRYRGRLFYASMRRSGVPVIADLRDKMTDPATLIDVADRLLCCAEGVRQFAVGGGYPAGGIESIPIPFALPGVPSPEQVSDVQRRYGLDEEPYLLFIGDITRNKGVYDLLEAYERWRPPHRKVNLVFAGTNREGEHFLREVQRTTNVIYLGHVPHGDALALVRGAEILVLPSRSEGLPRVILEAVALGTKVICPPGIPEFEQHLSEYVLPEVTPDCIVRMLKIVWDCAGSPSYPFAKHRLRSVVGDLAGVYGRLVQKVK